VPLAQIGTVLLFLPLPRPAADPGQDRTAIADAAQQSPTRCSEEGGLKICAKLVALRPPLRWLALTARAPSPSLPSLKSIRRIGTGHFQGPFGTFDTAPPPSAATRSMPRSARGPPIRWSCCTIATWWISGSPRNQVKSLIKDIQVPDLGDDGQPLERPARLSDHFKKPFPNPAAAAAANNGKAPPDLSLIVQEAREGRSRTMSMASSRATCPYDTSSRPEQIKEFNVTKGRHTSTKFYFPGHKIGIAAAPWPTTR